MVWDRFVTGHRECELRQHLDSFPPDTPIREIVDRCRVWECHSNVNDHSDTTLIVTATRSVCSVSEHSVEPVDPIAMVKVIHPVGLTEPEILLFQKILQDENNQLVKPV